MLGAACAVKLDRRAMTPVQSSYRKCSCANSDGGEEDACLPLGVRILGAKRSTAVAFII